jgi:hypothetical protein
MAARKSPSLDVVGGQSVDPLLPSTINDPQLPIVRPRTVLHETFKTRDHAPGNAVSLIRIQTITDLRDGSHATAIFIMPDDEVTGLPSVLTWIVEGQRRRMNPKRFKCLFGWTHERTPIAYRHVASTLPRW